MRDKTWCDYLAFRGGKKKTPAYSRDGYLFLGCRVERIEYDWETHIGKAYLTPGHCTDCKSVVRFFQMIDPRVRRIETFSDGHGDTSYDIAKDGAVRAYRPVRLSLARG